MRPALAVAGLVIGSLAAEPRIAQVKVPPDFKMPRAESSPGEVTFSHEKHRAQVAKVTLAAKQEGKLCGACHDGKTTMGGTVIFAIDQCDSCHKD